MMLYIHSLDEITCGGSSMEQYYCVSYRITNLIITVTHISEIVMQSEEFLCLA